MPFSPSPGGVPSGAGSGPSQIPTYVGLGLDAIGIGLNYAGQSGANQVNRDIAEAQMRFQREMSNTQWQRAVADIRASGLNPALAYSQGGNSAPSGASTRVENAFAGVTNSASAAANRLQNMQLMKSDIAFRNAQVRNMEMQTKQLELESLLRVEGISASNKATGARGVLDDSRYLESMLFREFLSRTMSERVLSEGLKNKVLSANAKDINISADLQGMLRAGSWNRQAFDKTWVGRNIMPVIDRLFGGPATFFRRR